MENLHGSTDDPLAMIAEARAAAADRFVTPWWYHPILGLLVAGLLIGLTFGGSDVRGLVLVVYLLGLAGLVSAYRSRTGVWIWGYSAGAASRWAYALGILYGVAMGLSVLIHAATGLAWPSWTLAGAVVAGSVVFGRRFDETLRAELRAGS